MVQAMQSGMVRYTLGIKTRGGVTDDSFTGFLHPKINNYERGIIMLRLLNNTDKETVTEYLKRNHYETTFLMGNVREFPIENNKEIRRCGDYYGYFDDNGQLKGVICFYNLGSCIPHFEDSSAVEHMTELMKERKFTFLLGMEKIISPLYEGIKSVKTVKEYSEDYYYINRDFKPFTVGGLNFEDAKAVDEDKAVSFIAHARKDGFGDVQTKEDILKTLKQRGSEEDFILAVKDDKVAAQACIQTATSHINQIGAVYTLTEERGKGYAKAVVSELCRRILKRGKIPTLFVKSNNTPALKAYQALGFEYYDNYLMVEFEK